MNSKTGKSLFWCAAKAWNQGDSGPRRIVMEVLTLSRLALIALELKSAKLGASPEGFRDAEDQTGSLELEGSVA
jgi:hypothetical protein